MNYTINDVKNVIKSYQYFHVGNTDKNKATAIAIHIGGETIAVNYPLPNTFPSDFGLGKAVIYVDKISFVFDGKVGVVHPNKKIRNGYYCE